MREWNSRKKTAGQQCNRILDSVVTTLRHNKITIDHAIYTKVSHYVKVSCLTVSNDYFLNTTNNYKSFPELRRDFIEHFEMKDQEVPVPKYLNLPIFQYPLGFSVDHTDHIMKLVNEWLLTGKCINIYTPFCTDSTY